MAATGLAALGRAVESHISADKTRFQKAYSFAAIRFVRENLLSAVADPGNRKAALAVLNSAAMSGCAFPMRPPAGFTNSGRYFTICWAFPRA